MVQPNIVENQLRRIGANYRFWNKPELKELPKILFEHETINHLVSGRYEGGFAILVSTDLRVILIDKKPFFLTLEDIRYERIANVELNHRLLDATLRLGALTKNLSFTGYNPAKMREMTSYIQERVMESRQARQGGYQPTPLPTEQFESREPIPMPQPLMDQPALKVRPEALPAPAVAQTAVPAQATDMQTGAIGQVAVMSMDEAANPSPYERLIEVMSSTVGPIQDEEAFTAPPKNPYRSPFMFRRRVSRFY